MKIGLDLTEKYISAALVDNGIIIRKTDMPIYAQKRDSNKVITEKIIYSIYELMSDEVSGIGISLPTTYDKNGRVVYDIRKIPHWKKIKIKHILKDEFLVPVAVDTDINCFLLGEYSNRTNHYTGNILCICADDKIDIGLMLDNKLLTSGKPSFNNINCLSDANYDFIRIYKESYNRTMEELQMIYRNIESAKANAPDEKVWEEIGSCIGRLISVLLYNYDIHNIILGGKLAGCLGTYKSYIDNYLLTLFPPKRLLNLAITKSGFDNPRLIGAVCCLKNTPVNSIA